jgi:serine/threonine-protein kinase
VKITDFGIAHAVGSPPVTVTGMLIGTPGYMAPERVAGAQATPASDLYALGMVAYECLAGAPPFSGTPLEVALAQRERPLPPLPMSVPLDVAAFVMQLTAKDAVWRPGSAAEVARRAVDLRDGLSRRPVGLRHGLPVVPAPAGPADPPMTSGDDRRLALAPPLPRSRAGRRASARAVSCALLAGLAGLLLAGVLRFSPAQHQVGAPSVIPGQSQGPVSASRPAGRHHADQSADISDSATRRPAADPAAVVAPTANEAAVTPSKPARKQGHGRGHRGDKKQGDRPGHGRHGGGSNGSGDANAQLLSN